MTTQQPQIILLREGTDTSQGTPQLISNINACMAVVDTVRTTLGPRGMDKLVHDDRVRVPSQASAEASYLANSEESSTQADMAVFQVVQAEKHGPCRGG